MAAPRAGDSILCLLMGEYPWHWLGKELLPPPSAPAPSAATTRFPFPALVVLGLFAPSSSQPAAVRWGNPVVTMTLLGGGADPNAVEFGRTILDHAVLGGNTDCVSLLVSAGAKLGVRTSILTAHV